MKPIHFKLNLYFPQSKGIQFALMLLSNALFFTAAAYLLPITNGTDDSRMCLIASGVYTGAPDAHLIFINFLYGSVLKFFYTHFAGVEWYALFFCVIHVISLAIIAFSILRADQNRWFKAAFLVLLYAAEIRLIFTLQFTTTAALCALSGLMLQLYGKKTFHAFGLCWFLLGVLIRFDAGMLVLLLMLPLFCFEIFKAKKWVKIAPIATVIICAFLFQYIDSQSYSKYLNGTYKEYDKLRGKLNDNPNLYRLEKNLPEGVSKNDLWLLQDFFIDPNVLTLEKMQQLNQKLNELPKKYLVKNVYYALTSRKWTVLFIAALFAFAIFLTKKRSDKLLFLSVLLLFFAAFVYVAINDYMKERVLISALLPVFFTLFFALKPAPHIHRYEYLFSQFLRSAAVSSNTGKFLQAAKT